MSIDVLKAGLLTTLQDRGRFGCAALGVGSAGAMDDVALRLANALVGNDGNAAALEMTLIGPRLRFITPATIALTGAPFTARCGGAEIASWRAIEIAAGSVLDVGTARHGALGYLAIRGGFAADDMLGSIATDVNARLGGMHGRPLREDDQLNAVSSDNAVADGPSPHVDIRRSSAENARWSLDPRPWFDADSTQPIRVIRGAHFDALDEVSRDALFTGEFRIAAESNRVGFRLDGPLLALTAPLDLISEPTAAGTLQLPPGGQSIVLMAEHPTIGGYPRIAQVAAVDLPRLAQRRPGDRLRFAEIDLDTAQTRYLEREHELARLIEAIQQRLTQ